MLIPKFYWIFFKLISYSSFTIFFKFLVFRKIILYFYHFLCNRMIFYRRGTPNNIIFFEPKLEFIMKLEEPLIKHQVLQPLVSFLFRVSFLLNIPFTPSGFSWPVFVTSHTLPNSSQSHLHCRMRYTTQPTDIQKLACYVRSIFIP